MRTQPTVMDETYLVGAGVLVSLVSSVLTYILTYQGGKVSDLEVANAQLLRRYRYVLKQVEAYHAVEAALCRAVALVEDQSEKTIKTEFRDEVERAGMVRPVMTGQTAREKLAMLSSEFGEGEGHVW